MNDESPDPATRDIAAVPPKTMSQEASLDVPARSSAPRGMGAQPLNMRSGRTPPVILDRTQASPPPARSAASVRPAEHRETPTPAAGVSAISPLLASPDTAPCVSTRPSWPVRPLSISADGNSGGKAELSGAVRTEEETLIAPFVDFEYYRSTYGDVLASNIDPVVHYARYGWKERRNPSRSFNTAFYLDTNPDVAGVDVNPLWHYVVTGRDEGRRSIKPANIGISILRHLTGPDHRAQSYVKPQMVSVLTDVALLNLLDRLASSSMFVVSVSHDDYTSAVGGTQVFIADEQTKFVQMGAAYLHISPLVARLRLAAMSDGTTIFRLILNGRQIGFADASQFAAVVAKMAKQLPEQRLLICHCLMGHRIDEIVALHAALQPHRSVYWLHDYSSICSSVTLLRNDVAFCGAPPAESGACRICIHGRHRAEHVARYKHLFTSIALDVVAPSQTALDLWVQGGQLPARTTRVHQHAEIQFSATRRSLIPIVQRGTANCPVRVAFAGHPATHKGWPAFSALLDECAKRGDYEFYHFWTDAEAAADPRVKGIAVTVTNTSRDDMVRALQDNFIDLVLVLSAWPETFSYVTYEAIAAGADVVTFADAGNVAAEIMRSGRGLVMKDLPAMLEFFVSGGAIRYVRLCYEQGNTCGELHHSGTTATLVSELFAPAAKAAAPARSTNLVRG